MAASNKLELVVDVDVNKGNASIRSFNSSLASVEQSASRASRGASAGIDGMTASMAKGATAGNLFADSIQKVLGWARELTVEVAKYAARTEVLGVVTQQLAKVNGLSAAGVGLLVDRVKALGITTQEAHGVIQKMIFAELDLSKATQLARAAQDAAVIAGVDSSEALDKIILGITTGQTRLLHTMGLQVSLEQTIQEEERKTGHALSETGKRAAMLNKVIEVSRNSYGTYEAAMEKAGKQMTSLNRYFAEAKNAVGQEFQPVLREVVDDLKNLAFWIKDNADTIGNLARGGAALIVAGGIGMLAAKLTGLATTLGIVNAAALANPIGLIAAGVAVAGGIIYSQWRKIEEQGRALDQEFQKWLTSQVTGAKTSRDLALATTSVEKAFAGGLIELREYTQALKLLEVQESRAYGWGNTGITATMPKAIDPAEQARIAREIAKRQAAAERATLEGALQAEGAAAGGAGKLVADMRREALKYTSYADEKGIERAYTLTVRTRENLERELQAKVHQLQKNEIAEYLKDEQDVFNQRLNYETRLYQSRLQHNVEVAKSDLDHQRELLRGQEDALGYARDAQMRAAEGVDAQTIQQKVRLEQRKAEIEVDYLEKVRDIKLRLFDMDTARMVLEEQAALKQLGYHIGAMYAQIRVLKQQRGEIRREQEDATDAAIQAARENASIRQVEMIRDHNRQIFDSLKEQAGGVFDALLQKSQSVWSAIGNSLKTALLTAIKDVVSSRVAALLMQLFTGTRVSLAQGGMGTGSLARLGGLLGIGAVPVFGGGGGGGGWGPISGGAAGGGGGIGGLGSSLGGGLFAKGGWGGLAGGLKDFLGFGGGVQYAPGMATTWAASTMGQKLSALGRSNAALAGGATLAMLGLRRGGLSGLAMTTAGGALIGYKFGGLLGAAIGASIGAVAGIVRLFVKGAQEKAREKIKARYGVDIQDKTILRQIVDMAKSAYGGNLDMAIASDQVRELVALYAMTTGQKGTGLPTSMQPVSLIQSGGSLFQGAAYSNGTPVPSLGGLTSLDSIAQGRTSNAGGTVVVNIGFDSKMIGTAIVRDGRVVTQGAVNGMKSNANRRELTALQLSPGTLTA